MKDGVWYGQCSTAHHTVRSQKFYFSVLFQTQKIVVKLTRPRFFLEPPISQDQNWEREEAHVMTSEPTVFSLFFQLVIIVETQHFKSSFLVVGLQVRPRDKQQEECKDRHAISQPTTPK
jgi:hypothetical protein